MRRAKVALSGGRVRGGVFEDFYELSAGSKEHDGAKLFIDGAAQNELVALLFDHFLDGDALKMLGAFEFGDGGFDVIVG